MLRRGVRAPGSQRGASSVAWSLAGRTWWSKGSGVGIRRCLQEARRLCTAGPKRPWLGAGAQRARRARAGGRLMPDAECGRAALLLPVVIGAVHAERQVAIDAVGLGRRQSGAAPASGLVFGVRIRTTATVRANASASASARARVRAWSFTFAHVSTIT
eukprot:scaffold82507_cov72-Phaeocystis_antarctica.AAC.5